MAHGAVHFVNDRLERFRQVVSWRSDRLDAIPHPLHRALARPALEVAFAPVLPRGHLAAVNPKKSKPVARPGGPPFVVRWIGSRSATAPPTRPAGISWSALLA